MGRKGGGLVGKKVTPAGTGPTAAASGIWGLQDILEAETAGILPQSDVPPVASNISANVTMEVLEQNTLAVTFSGATDADGDTVFDWTVSESSGVLSLSPSSASDANSITPTFTAAAVDSDTDIDITVTVTDQWGLSASKVFTGDAAFTIKNNIAPVVTNVAPTNVSFPLDVFESSAQVITFSGATDTEDTDSTLTYSIVNIDPSATISSVSPSSDSSSPFSFTFNTAAVSSDTDVSFGVRVTDSIGEYNTKTFTNALDVKNNLLPDISSLTHNSDLPSELNKDTTYAITWSGATDPDGTDGNIDYTVVDVTNNPSPGLTTNGGTNGADINFVVGSVEDDAVITFKIRCTDEQGGYTESSAYSVTLKAEVFTAATGGDYIYTTGNDKIHIFKSSDDFVVSTAGTDPSVDYLVVAGGGRSGSGNGGGGAGGYRTSYGSGNISGALGAVESAIDVTAQTYSIIVGAGNADSSALGITSDAGGWAYAWYQNNGNYQVGGDGGSGSGGGKQCANGGGCAGGSGTAGQGMDGNEGYHSSPRTAGGGGGGAWEEGYDAHNGATGNDVFQAGMQGAGGNGAISTIITTTQATNASVGEVISSDVWFAGGGAGWKSDNGGKGGGGNGETWDGQAPWVTYLDGNPGDANTGGGGAPGHKASQGEAGGSGCVILRYQYQASQEKIMAHFAKLGLNYKILTVVVVANSKLENENGQEVEQLGIDFLEELTSYPYWVQTSFNTNGNIHRLGGTPFRKNYASRGDTYDEELDAFIAPKPWASWTLNEETCLWEPPTRPPWEDANQGADLIWDEEVEDWCVLEEMDYERI